MFEHGNDGSNRLKYCSLFWRLLCVILFTKDALVIEKGMEILRFMVPTFWTYVFIEIFSGSLRGMGNSFIPMILTSLGVCALRVFWLFSAVPIWPEVKTVIFSYPLDLGCYFDTFYLLLSVLYKKTTTS